MAVGTSWGRWPRHASQVIPIVSRFASLPQAASMLPYGNGRSYGDVCLNSEGVLLDTRGMDRFIHFDAANGILECEAGVLLRDIIIAFLPQGWLPPVMPGTAFVTVGGAVANDVHGKNHHGAGSFAQHVIGFELLRSDGQVLRCTPDHNEEWFAATVGGLGLTGLIRTVRVRLRRATAWIEGDSQRFNTLREFFSLSAMANSTFEYCVAWLDCTASQPRLGRGIFMRGNHCPSERKIPSLRPLRLPFTPWITPINRLSVRLFNELHFHRAGANQSHVQWHYDRYLFPLDRIHHWNRIYGPHGFFQYQCVLPPNEAEAALADMLQAVGRSGLSSPLVVLKKFGDMPPIGLLSFARPGITLALDFPNRGSPTLQLLESLDAITRGASGAVYPAKDARMSAQSFQQYFPHWREFQRFIDPSFSSSFWRRVTHPTS